MHYPMDEGMLSRQYTFLVQRGELIKKEQPLLKLIPAHPDPKKRRQLRKQTRRLKRKK
jgi:hypothetical protein